MYNGLCKEEIEKNRNQYGTNEINIKKQQKFLNLFLESFGDPMIKILLIALAIKVVFLFKEFDFFETLGIVIAILLSTLISTISEYGSNKAFEKLDQVNDNIKVKVKREKKITEISISDVVVGDLILLESGDKVAADGILVEGNLSVDESILNGESKEAKKITYVIGKELEQNKLYRGTTIYSGYGKMIVKSVGNNTVYGKIALELHEKKPISPLRKRLVELAKIISRIGYIGAFLVTFAFLFSKIIINNHYDIILIKETISNFPLMINYIIYALTLSVTIIVVAVPEGLPMMITLVLSSNMKKMLKNNVLVRKLVGIETAGNINILLTDKTGTLTKGKLEVIKLYTSDFQTLSKKELLKSDIFLDALMYNNDSMFDENGKVIGGNLTDRAILSFLGEEKLRTKKIIFQKHFDSKDKYSSVTLKEKITYFKGAPDILLSKCTKVITKLGNEELFLKKQAVKEKIEEATKNGVRVLMLAYKKNDSQLDSLVFMGLIYLKDDIRKEAKDGIKYIKHAGIQTIMITGDAKETAISVAKEVGILEQQTDLILDSIELNQLTDEELTQKLKNIRVIARALPKDKSRLVRVAQEKKLVVGMTGDGVNDAPALKRADVGFAMGSGTEVAKEASDIVILDNNILSISKAILYGRTIFKSIRKFIIYQLSVNMCALLLSIIGPFIGFSSPITIVQMLWLNMIMDTFSAVAFSYEPALLEYMEEPPKKPNEKIMNSYMYNEILVTSLYSATLCILFLKLSIVRDFFRIGDNNKYLMTAYFALFIFLGIFNAFNARTYRINIFSNLLNNKVFIIIISFIIIVQIYLIYYGGDVFRTYGLEASEFLFILLIALTVWPVDVIRKIFLKMIGAKRMV